MAEMKMLKMSVMRYNPETDNEPHAVTYQVPTMSRRHCWMRWAISKTTWRRISPTAGPAGWLSAAPAA